MQRSRLKASKCEPHTESGPNTSPVQRGSRCSWLELACVFLLSFALQSNTLGAEFTFDDARGVVANKDLESSTPWTDLFSHDFWGSPMSNFDSHKSYRPVTVLTFRWNTLLSGLNPFAFHLTNVVLHGLVCCLFHAFSARLLPATWSRWVSTLLFLAHPVHAEAVANIVGRAEVLCGVFFLTAILTVWPALAQPEVSWVRVASVIALALLAMLAKEQGIMVLPLIAAIDFVRTAASHWSDDARSRLSLADMLLSSKVLETRRFLSREESAAVCALRVRTLAFALAASGLLGLRVAMLHGAQPIFNPTELPATFAESPATRALTLSYLPLFNAGLLLFPARLSIDWSHGSIPLVESFSDSRAGLTLLFYALLAGFAWVVAKPVCHFAQIARPGGRRSGLPSSSARRAAPSERTGAQRDPPASSACNVLEHDGSWTRVAVGFAFLVLTFLPGSNLFFTVGYVVAERTLYLPSMGYCILFATAVHHGLAKIPAALRDPARALALLYIIVLGCKTYTRNAEWASDFSIHQADSATNVLNAKLQSNFGLLNYERAKAATSAQEKLHYEEQAILFFQRALDVDPHNPAAALDYGNLLADRGDLPGAVAMFKRGLGTRDRSRVILRLLGNLATAEFRLGQHADSELHFKSVLEIDEHFVSAHTGLGALYGSQGRERESYQHFMRAIELQPHVAEGYFNLGTLLVQQGHLDEAETMLNKALAITPGHPGALNNLEVVRYQRKQQRLKHS